jgi:hypothetical protein
MSWADLDSTVSTMKDKPVHLCISLCDDGSLGIPEHEPTLAVDMYIVAADANPVDVGPTQMAEATHRKADAQIPKP